MLTVPGCLGLTEEHDWQTKGPQYDNNEREPIAKIVDKLSPLLSQVPKPNSGTRAAVRGLEIILSELQTHAIFLQAAINKLVHPDAVNDRLGGVR